METNLDSTNVLTVRLVKGVACAFSLQLIPITICVGYESFTLLHPWTWFFNIAATVFSIRTWLSLLLIFFSMLLVAATTLQSLSLKTGRVESRFQAFKSVLNWQIVLKFLAFVFLVISLLLSYLSLSGLSVTAPCPAHSQLVCLSPNNVFVLACSLWVGLYYFLRNELFSKQLSFPIIPQPKISQIRFKLITSLVNSSKTVVIPCLYYVVIHFFIGNTLQAFFSSVFNARLKPDSDKYLESVSLSSLFAAWFISSLTFFSLNCLRKCLKVYLTDPYPFEFSVLLQSLKTRDSLIKSLALYDLNLISSGRRGDFTEIYALSQPGGVPHAWNNVLREYEIIVREFLFEAEVVAGTRKRLSQPEPEKPLSPPTMNMRIRRLVDGEKSPPVNVPDPQPEIDIGIPKIMSKVWDFAPIKYVFAPTPEIQLSALLEDSQKVTWAVESVANLTARALTEDRFGVVVNDVPTVVTTLLSLLQHLGVQRRVRQRDRTARMRLSILSAARRGLTKIAVAYAEYLDHLHLPLETVQIMKSFAAMKVN